MLGVLLGYLMIQLWLHADGKMEDDQEAAPKSKSRSSKRGYKKAA